MEDKLTNQDYWNSGTKHAKIEISDNDPIKKWIKKYESNFTDIKNCIEIGCYSGRFLTIFGEMGAELSGIDYVENLEDVEKNLKEKGYKTGIFKKEDFTKFSPIKKYDCVMSFGLIEHFKDWRKVFQKHIDLVDEKGFIIIETPNFNGFMQRIPRKFFDRENYLRHNIYSMNLKKWEKLLRDNNFEIISSEYFGGYEIWFENQNLSKIEKIIKKVILRINSIIKNRFFSKPESKHFSSYLGIIAYRK